MLATEWTLLRKAVRRAGREEKGRAERRERCSRESRLGGRGRSLRDGSCSSSATPWQTGLGRSEEACEGLMGLEGDSGPSNSEERSSSWSPSSCSIGTFCGEGPNRSSSSPNSR